MINRKKVQHVWEKFWMKFSGKHGFERAATWFATCFSVGYYDRSHLAWLSTKGYVSLKTILKHDRLKIQKNVFIDDNVIIYRFNDGGEVCIGSRSSINRDCIIQTGQGGSVEIGENSHVQPRCIFSAFLSKIKIGSDVQIAPNCSFYSYDHGTEIGQTMQQQQLRTKGGIEIGDDVWIGVGAIILDGVRVGNGAVIGAGSVVKADVPVNGVAVGNPAVTVKFRKIRG